jgi:hypothetical protein
MASRRVAVFFFSASACSFLARSISNFALSVASLPVCEFFALQFLCLNVRFQLLDLRSLPSLSVCFADNSNSKIRCAAAPFWAVVAVWSLSRSSKALNAFTVL